MKMLVNLFCRDIDAQMSFYARLLLFEEIERSRSPIYRALDTGDAELGFNDFAAYALLGLTDAGKGVNSPAHEIPSDTLVRVFATFMAERREQVDDIARRAVALGGTIVKAPYQTYYGQWQAVLADPEGNMFRISWLMPNRQPAS